VFVFGVKTLKMRNMVHCPYHIAKLIVAVALGASPFFAVDASGGLARQIGISQPIVAIRIYIIGVIVLIITMSVGRKMAKSYDFYPFVLIVKVAIRSEFIPIVSSLTDALL